MKESDNDDRISDCVERVYESLDSGDKDRARELAQSFVADNPASRRLMFTFAIVLHGLGDLSGAEHAVRESMQLPGETDPETYWKLGQILFELHRIDESIAAFERGIEIAKPDIGSGKRPDYLAFTRVAQIALAGGYREFALRMATKALELEPGWAEARDIVNKLA